MKRIFLVLLILAMCLCLFACGDDGDAAATAISTKNNDTDVVKVTTITEEQWKAAFAEGNYTVTIDDASARKLFELLGVEYIPAIAKYTEDVICFCSGWSNGFIGSGSNSSGTIGSTTSSTSSTTSDMARSLSMSGYSTSLYAKSGTGCAVKFEGQWYYFDRSEGTSEETCKDVWVALDNPYVVPCSFLELTYDEDEKAYCFYDTDANQKYFYYFENGVLVREVIIVDGENGDLTNAVPTDSGISVTTRKYSNRGSTVITASHDFSIDKVKEE